MEEEEEKKKKKKKKKSRNPLNRRLKGLQNLERENSYPSQGSNQFFHPTACGLATTLLGDVLLLDR